MRNCTPVLLLMKPEKRFAADFPFRHPFIDCMFFPFRDSETGTFGMNPDE